MQFYNLSNCSYSKGLQKGIVTLLTWVFSLFIKYSKSTILKLNKLRLGEI